ncbi:MAG: hypothetical protein EXR36_06215 [Betaproteobacteria bacterium]|nr:hypothetical protein [Betaproteobacteria bacterium]
MTGLSHHHYERAAIIGVLLLSALGHGARAESDTNSIQLAQGAGTEIIDAAAVTAARQAGSPGYDKAKNEAPPTC